MGEEKVPVKKTGLGGEGSTTELQYQPPALSLHSVARSPISKMPPSCVGIQGLQQITKSLAQK